MCPGLEGWREANPSCLIVSPRQEILLATAAREPQPDYRSRTNHDLMLVIEDQWRKQLHEEQEEEEAERRKEEAARVENIVAKEGRRSRQERETDWKGMEEAKGETDGKSSRQEVTVDGQGEVGRMGRKEAGWSSQEMGADGIEVGTEGQRIGQKGSADSGKVEKTEGRVGRRSGSKQTVVEVRRLKEGENEGKRIMKTNIRLT